MGYPVCISFRFLDLFLPDFIKRCLIYLDFSFSTIFSTSRIARINRFNFFKLEHGNLLVLLVFINFTHFDKAVNLRITRYRITFRRIYRIDIYTSSHLRVFSLTGYNSQSRCCLFTSSAWSNLGPSVYVFCSRKFLPHSPSTFPLHQTSPSYLLLSIRMFDSLHMYFLHTFSNSILFHILAPDEFFYFLFLFSNCHMQDFAIFCFSKQFSYKSFMSSPN